MGTGGIPASREALNQTPRAVHPDGTSATGLFDLRRWLEKAKAIGQLKEVEGADLKFELGCITDLNAKRRGPALLFKNFKGYNKGFRVLTGSMMNAATLGLRWASKAR